MTDPEESRKRLGRRGWLEALVPVAADAAAEIQGWKEATLPRRRRPPGAVDEATFLARCTRCGDCIRACPHGAVHYYNEHAPAEIQATPVMLPDSEPCQMCDGFPCAAACTPKALVPPMTRFVSIGTVRIAQDRCIAFLGPECGACVGACPHPLKAITLAGCRPQVDREACIGCGRCIRYCPMTPSAIEVEPLEG